MGGDDHRDGRHVKRYRTRSGTILTEADLARLVEEAERGYCTVIVETADSRARCFQPMPCPVHGGDDEPGPDAERWSP